MAPRIEHEVQSGRGANQAADPGALVAAADARGVRLSTLDSYRAGRRGPAGLVLGYGNIADRDVEPAVVAVAAAARGIGLLV